MLWFWVVMAALAAACTLDVITTNRGIANGGSEDIAAPLIGHHPSPLKVLLFNAAQIAVAGCISILGYRQIWPWVACAIFPAMLALAHGVGAAANWRQAFPQKGDV